MERLTLEQAITLLDEVHEYSPTEERPHLYKIKTLYNAIHAGKLLNHGTRHCAKIEKRELLREFGPKKRKAA